MNDKPIHTIRVGAVKASIWENKGPEGRVFHTTTLTRAYKDENDQWKESNSYLPDELPKLELVARKAFEFVQLAAQEKGEPESFSEKVSAQRGGRSAAAK